MFNLTLGVLRHILDVVDELLAQAAYKVCFLFKASIDDGVCIFVPFSYFVLKGLFDLGLGHATINQPLLVTLMLYLFILIKFILLRM